MPGFVPEKKDARLAETFCQLKSLPGSREPLRGRRGVAGGVLTWTLVDPVWLCFQSLGRADRRHQHIAEVRDGAAGRGEADHPVECRTSRSWTPPARR